MARSRSPLLFLCALLALAGSFVTRPVAAEAAGYRLDPAKNIPPPSRAVTACTYHPYRGTCKRLMIRALNHARAVMGEPAYRLPAGFRALTGSEQLLILSNQDRRLYGRASVIGLNAPLNVSALQGATHDSDPAFVSIDGTGPAVGASNWAGGARSPLLAYYLWMYADGPSSGTSGNVSCRQPGDPSCWEHRHATLMRSGSSNKLAMGVGHGKGPSRMPAWTELYEAFWPSTSMTYVPTVTQLSSSYGSYLGGTAVTITGYAFIHVTGVTVGGQPAKYSVSSRTRISVLTPAGAIGRTYVRVSTTGGVSSSTRAAAFTYG